MDRMIQQVKYADMWLHVSDLSFNRKVFIINNYTDI